MDAMRSLLGHGYRIDHLLTISPEDAATKYHISGYKDLREFASQYGISVYHVQDYKLIASKADAENISEMNLDLLIVFGWQRIIPKWLLDALPLGAIGMHGSPEQPPFGRGHSVMNWSCIEGRKEFLAYLFFYVSKVNSGPIIGSKRFEINAWDTCETLHFKYQQSMMRLLKDGLPKILCGPFEGTPQSNEGATYYPARTPADGLINWNSPAEDIYNFVRGVTAPYPGHSLSFMGGE